MKQLILTFCLVIGLSFASYNAVAQAPANSFAFRHNWYNYISPLGSDNFDASDIYSTLDGKGLEIAYYRRILNRSFFAVPVKFGVASVKDDTYNFRSNDAIGNLDLLFQQHIFKYGSVIDPYLNAGVGSAYNFDRNDFGVNIPVSVGLNVRLLDNVYINLQTQHRFAANNTEGWHHGLGLHFFFGGEAPPPPPVDTDGDGIVDELDACPTEPGPATTGGCPDRDNDGIADSKDKCPDDAGLEEFEGCPDSDGDGIVDADDKCPSVKGIAKFDGCPDSDNDGIMDADDKCPREAGPVATGGCPDRDGDGVADRDDACPDKAGEAAHRGCPDTDGDGVYDDTDRCVSEPGPANNGGCPVQEQIVRLDISQVQFETASSTLVDAAYPVLDRIAELMNKYTDYNLSISGHTDNVGNDAMNLRLSKARAKTCYDYLVSKGVAGERMSHEGYGETKPIADNGTEEGRATNRRVDFDLEEK
ncbi:MAG: OmpA family protein [Saprospiraceae bacterium]